MTVTYQKAAAAIRQLQRNQHVESFTDLKRRHRHFRSSSQFIQWEVDLRAWQTLYAYLLCSGLQAVSEPDDAGIRNARFERRSNGAIIWDGHPADNALPRNCPAQARMPDLPTGQPRTMASRPSMKPHHQVSAIPERHRPASQLQRRAQDNQG